ncbi:MAG TPA: LD-carboxypeptidase [Iamia sp.]|nr:LD-carboxypeptidase [Iamia sp.]
MRGPRVVVGDRVRLVSPASWPEQDWVDEQVALLASWGLVPEVGAHAVDRWGYQAGREQDRIADLDDAFRDPGVRAVITTRGGAGAYRIADRIDLDAVRADPKPLVGFSDITNLHLVLWEHARLASIHGCLAGARCTASVRRLLMEPSPLTVERDPEAYTAAVEVPGRATGPLLGGNLREVAGAIGAACPTCAAPSCSWRTSARSASGRSTASSPTCAGPAPWTGSPAWPSACSPGSTTTRTGAGCCSTCCATGSPTWGCPCSAACPPATVAWAPTAAPTRSR